MLTTHLHLPDIYSYLRYMPSRRGRDKFTSSPLPLTTSAGLWNVASLLTLTLDCIFGDLVQTKVCPLRSCRLKKRTADCILRNSTCRVQIIKMLALEFTYSLSYYISPRSKNSLTASNTRLVTRLETEREKTLILQIIRIFWNTFVILNTVLVLVCFLQVHLISDLIFLWISTACFTVDNHERFEDAGRSPGKIALTGIYGIIYRCEKN